MLKYFDKKSFKGKSKENNFRIIGDEARLMKKGDSKSYTFQIEHNMQTGSIENIVLNLEKDGAYQAYIATYHLNTADKRAVVEHGKLPPLKNKVSLTPIEFNAEAIITNLDQKGSGGCYAYVEVIETSRATGWEVTGYRLKRVPCSGNGGGNSGGGSGYDNPGGPSGGSDPGYDGGLPSGGGGGGNGGSLPPPSSGDPGPNHDSIDGTDIMTAPIMRLNTIGKLQDLLELSSFDSPKMEWLRKSASADQIFDLYNFIQEEQESEEAKAFANEAIDAYINDGEVDFEDRLEGYDFTEESTEILSFEQDYRNRMSQAEIAIFDNLSRFQQLDYLHSAYLAQEYAKFYFEDTIKVQYNGKGDAYRHTLWNALGAAKLGEKLMEQLTDAHEERPPRYPYEYKEVEMDLYNNEKGRSIGSQSVFMLMMKVKFSLEKGNLRYLNNLNQSNNPLTKNQVTAQSELIKTNL